METLEFLDDHGDKTQVDVYDGMAALFVYENNSHTCAEFTDEDTRKRLANAIWPRDDYSLNPVAAADISFNEGMIRLAIIHKRSVTFAYAKNEGDVIELRSVAPDSIRTDTGHTLFQGKDKYRDGIRQYRLDRVMGDVIITAP